MSEDNNNKQEQPASLADAMAMLSGMMSNPNMILANLGKSLEGLYASANVEIRVKNGNLLIKIPLNDFFK